jgi:hypothetical protein
LGKPIPKPTLRHAYEKAVSDAKVSDSQFRDFRHYACTRSAGLPFEIGERGIGHKLRGIAGRYIDFSDDQSRYLSKNIPSCSQGNQSAVGGSE